MFTDSSCFNRETANIRQFENITRSTAKRIQHKRSTILTMERPAASTSDDPRHSSDRKRASRRPRPSAHGPRPRRGISGKCKTSGRHCSSRQPRTLPCRPHRNYPAATVAPDGSEGTTGRTKVFVDRTKRPRIVCAVRAIAVSRMLPLTRRPDCRMGESVGAAGCGPPVDIDIPSRVDGDREEADTLASPPTSCSAVPPNEGPPPCRRRCVLRRVERWRARRGNPVGHGGRP